MRNLRNVVLVHLAWSLWAFSYTYVQGSLTLAKLFIETFIGPAAGVVLSAADAAVFADRLKQVRFSVVFVVCCGERCGLRRDGCVQANGAPFIAVAVILSAALVAVATWHHLPLGRHLWPLLRPLLLALRVPLRGAPPVLQRHGRRSVHYSDLVDQSDDLAGVPLRLWSVSPY